MNMMMGLSGKISRHAELAALQLVIVLLATAACSCHAQLMGKRAGNNPLGSQPCWVPTAPLVRWGALAHQIPDCNVTQFEAQQAAAASMLGRKLKGILLSLPIHG